MKLTRILSLILTIALTFSCATVATSAQTTQQNSLPKIVVSQNGHYLQTEDGDPFFYLADTAWELFHRTTREEADMYLTDRANKGFTAIQCVFLAEHNGLTTGNSYGHKPFNGTNPESPAIVSGSNNDYWDHCDYIINKTTELGMYAAVLPTWGDKVELSWGVGPVVFTTEQKAYNYGRFVGDRYKNYTNIIWVLGGDRETGYQNIWTAMAEGIADGVNGVNNRDGKADYSTTLMTYHPARSDTSSAAYQNATWLDFNMYQSGHHDENAYATYGTALSDFAKTPTKPTLNAEPCYENHPIKREPANGFFNDHHIRKASYWSVFSGGAGITYGAHSIWQFYTKSREATCYPQEEWMQGLNLPGSSQMVYLKNLMLSRPYFNRVPDQSLVESYSGWANYVSATRDTDNSYIMVYYPQENLSKKIYATRLTGTTMNGWWYNPRDGKCYDSNGNVTTGPAFTITKTDKYYTSPGTDKNKDWVLILEDASKNYSVPGQPLQAEENPYETNAEGMLWGIDNNNVADFKASFNYDSDVEVKVYNGNTEVTGGKVGTGMTVKMIKGSQTIESYTAVIYGDTDGDGATSVVDLLMIKSHILEAYSLSGCYLQAAKVEKGNTVTSSDLLKVKLVLLQADKIDQ